MHYADTSALVKLVVAEPESPALRRWLATAEAAVCTSDLARTELMRAVLRAAPDRAVRAREVLGLSRSRSNSGTTSTRC